MTKIIYIIALLFSIATTAQKQLEVTLDPITSIDLSPIERAFTFRYHIKNTTSNPVHFFLKPNDLIANAASSMTLFTVYKIYQNNEFQDMDGPFFPAYPKQKSREQYQHDFDQLIENYRKNGGTSTNKSWIFGNQMLLESKMTLLPGETKDFVIEASWNHIRSVTNGDIEYYLNENGQFEIELILDLKKNEFKDQLSESEYLLITNDPNFVSGLFTSNRVVINFGR